MMETSAVWFAMSASFRSNDVGLADRLAVQHPIIAEAAQVERAIFTEGDELAECAPDRRRLLQAVPREPVRHQEVWHVRCRTDDDVLVEHVVIVMPGPGADQLYRLERRHAVGEGRPDH